MKIYHYYYDTKEFYSEEEYQEIEGLGLPANSTSIPPLEDKEGYATVFNTDAQEWVYDSSIRDENLKIDKINILYNEYMIINGLVETKAHSYLEGVYYKRLSKFFALLNKHHAGYGDFPKWPLYPVTIFDVLFNSGRDWK